MTWDGSRINSFLGDFSVKKLSKMAKKLGSDLVSTQNFYKPKLKTGLKRFKMQFYIYKSVFYF